MTDLDLDLIERLDRETTPGPWTTYCGHYVGVGEVGFSAYATEKQPNRSNAELIAHYRTACPALAAEVRRLRARLEAAEKVVGALRDWRRASDAWDAGKKIDVLLAILSAYDAQDKEAK